MAEQGTIPAIMRELPADGRWRMQSHNFPASEDERAELAAAVKAGLVEKGSDGDGLISKWRRKAAS